MPHWHEAIRSEAPQHKVTLTRPIYLGVHEVTQSQYEQVMGHNPSAFAPTGVNEHAVPNLVTTHFPVESVSWNNAAQYCEKLSQKEGAAPSYKVVGDVITLLERGRYSLPSEAEWEFACRAGTTTKFWTGDGDEALDEAAWTRKNSDLRTHTVGMKRANPFGLFDMHGNVSEWVEDRWIPDGYTPFSPKVAINPITSERDNSIGEYVLRGGEWSGPTNVLRRSSARIHRAADYRYHSGDGFRVAMSVSAVKLALNAGAKLPNDEWFDVLPLIDPQADKWTVPQRTGQNDWRMENGALVVGRDPLASKLLLPLDSDWQAYECELEFTRRIGNAGLNINLPTKVGECPLIFDPPGQGGVHLGTAAKGVHLVTGTQLTTGQRTTIRVAVRRQQDTDRVNVAVNGATVGEWAGDRSQIAHTFHEGFPNDRRLSLWIHPGGNEFVFHQIRVRMLDGGTAETLRASLSADTPASALTPANTQ